MNIFNQKDKYYAYFVSKKQNIYKYVKKKRISVNAEKIKFRKGTYKIDTEIPSFSRGNKYFFFVDINGNQIFFSKDKVPESWGKVMLDLYLARNIITQLTANLSNQQYKLNIMILVGGAVVGGLFGYIIAGMG